MLVLYKLLDLLWVVVTAVHCALYQSPWRPKSDFGGFGVGDSAPFLSG